jgi:hypothetical protein
MPTFQAIPNGLHYLHVVPAQIPGCIFPDLPFAPALSLLAANKSCKNKRFLDLATVLFWAFRRNQAA